MSNQQQKNTNLAPGEGVAWYKQFWPWFIISLPASAVVASLITLWIAVSNPDQIVIDDDQYRQVSSNLKAQPSQQKENQEETDKPGSAPD